MNDLTFKLHNVLLQSKAIMAETINVLHLNYIMYYYNNVSEVIIRKNLKI